MNGFWRHSQQAIFDIRVTDIDVASYQNKTPEKVIRKEEDEKKNSSFM